MNRAIVLSSALMIIITGCTNRDGKSPGAGQAPGAKLCALTFDDGPDPVKTGLVLDRLEKYGIVASFFVVGQRLDESTAATVKRAVAMGCSIENHSWNYDSLTGKSEDEIRKLADDTTKAIKKYSGKKPAFFRPPNLALSAPLFKAVDLPFAGGVVGNDWKGQGTNAENRARRVLAGMRDGAIILLHDVQPDPHPTPEALDILIPELKAQGYEFVTVRELFRRKGIKPSSMKGALWTYVE